MNYQLFLGCQKNLEIGTEKSGNRKLGNRRVGSSSGCKKPKTKDPGSNPGF
jgi:hypothetical protein